MKFKSFFILFSFVHIFANYDRYSRVSPESVLESVLEARARTERVRRSRSQVTSRSQSGEWRE